ncbi:unnamed protein product [Schistosoma margrebowiei]|uniref:Reverse transcriptase domain-containing protein n=1 Tax=Schistosoma margrebowiei TaxID=48269 RepID=A0A183MP67_9TREM|nr:unnamed protein product [Schistosoma margrebowiei]
MAEIFHVTSIDQLSQETTGAEHILADDAWNTYLTPVLATNKRKSFDMYFAESHTELARSMLSASHHPNKWYPFAVTGIHLTKLSYNLMLKGYLKYQFYNMSSSASIQDFNEFYYQIATLRIIVEQSIEWNSSLYINFIDYKKAFDSEDRTTLWKLLRHYGVPQNIVNIIQSSYDGLNCKIVDGGQLTKSFEVKTGVRQGCLLSPSLFLLVIDWIMKTSTSEGKHGIQWTSRMQLDDLDFAIYTKGEQDSPTKHSMHKPNHN